MFLKITVDFIRTIHYIRYIKAVMSGSQIPGSKVPKMT